MKKILVNAFCLFLMSSFSLNGQQFNWAVPLQDKEIDILEPYNNDNILMGTFGMKNYTWRPKEGYLYMINANTGDTVWSHKRISPNSLKILSAGEKIICYENDTTSMLHYFFALNPSSGKQIWYLKIKGRLELYPVERNLKFIVINSKKLSVNHLLLEDGTSKQLFEYDIDNEKEKLINYRLITNGLLIFYSDHLKLLSDSGQMVWTTIYPMQGVASNPIVEEIEDKLLIILSETAYLIDISTGQIENTYFGGTQKEIEDKYEGINNSFKQLIQQLGKKSKITFEDLLSGNMTISRKEKKGKESLYNLRSKLINDYAIESIIFLKDQAIIQSSLDQSSFIIMQGKEQKLLANEEIKSNLFFDNEFIYFTCENYFCKLNLETQEIKKVSLPENFFRDNTYSDKILINEDQFLIFNELGICAYSLNLEPRYSIYIEGSMPFTIPYHQHRLTFFNFSTEESDLNVLQAIQGINTSFNNYYTSQFRMMDDMYRRQYETSSSPFSRLSTLDHRMSNLRRYQKAQKVDAAMDVVYGFLGVGQEIANVLNENEISSKIESTIASINYAQQLNDICIQDNYYMRPFVKNGWFLAVVDIRTGERANINLGAYNKFLQINSINTFPFLYDPGKSRLIIKYFSQNAKSYEQASFSDEPIRFRWPRKEELPMPSLISLNLNEIKFSSNNSDLVPPPIQMADQELLNQIRNGDLDKVKMMLNTGANPNAIDRFGTSALMYATLKRNVKMYKLLISSGSSGDYLDYNNLSAYTYGRFFLYGGGADPVTGQAIKAFRKSSKD